MTQGNSSNNITNTTVDSITNTGASLKVYVNSAPGTGSYTPTAIFNLIVQGDSNFSTAYLGDAGGYAGTLTSQGNLTTDIVFTGDGVFDLSSNKTMTGNISTLIDNKGNLFLNEGSSVVGTIGSATDKLSTIRLNHSSNLTYNTQYDHAYTLISGVLGVLTFNDTLNGNLDLAVNGTVSVMNGSHINGTITTQTNETGSLVLNGNSMVTGSIGSASQKFKTVTSNTALGETNTFLGDIYISQNTLIVGGVGTTSLYGNVTGNVDFSADGIVDLAASKTITGNVDNKTGTPNQGTLILGDGADVTGTVGATNSLKNVQLNNTTAYTIDSAWNTQQFEANGLGQVNIDSNLISNLLLSENVTLNLAGGNMLSGNIDANTANQGKIILGDGAIVSGTVGVTNALENIQLNNTGAYDLNESWSTQQFELNGTGQVNVDNNLSANLLFNGDTTLSLATGNQLTGNLIVGTTNQGVLELNGDNTVDGEIGSATLKLKEIISLASNIQTNTFKSDVFVSDNTIKIRGDGTHVFEGNITGNILFENSNGYVNIAENKSVTGNVSTNIANQSNIILNDGATVSGTVGAINALANIQLNNTAAYDLNESWNTRQFELNGIGQVNVDNDLTSDVLFNGNGTLNLAVDKILFGNITTQINNTGTLILNENATTTGTIANATEKLSSIRFNRSSPITFDLKYENTNKIISGVTDIFMFNDSFNGDLDFAVDGVVSLAATQSIGGNVDNVTGNNGIGTLILNEGANVVGLIGTTNTLKNIQFNKNGDLVFDSKYVNTETVTSAVSGTLSFPNGLNSNLDFAVDGVVDLANEQDINGNITTQVHNTGMLQLHGNSTITGSIGEPDKQLKSITSDAVAGQTDTFNGAVAAKTITASGNGGLQFNDNASADIHFMNNGTANIASGKTLTGDVTTANDDQGSLTIEGGGLFLGNAGSATHRLNSITADTAANQTNILSGNKIFSANTSLNGSGETVIDTDINGNLEFGGDGKGILEVERKLYTIHLKTPIPYYPLI